MKMVAFSEVCNIQGGTQPPKSEWINFPNVGYVRMLQIRDFTQPKESNIAYVKKTSVIKTCEANDILIGRYGASIGKILTGLEGAYNVAMAKCIFDKSVLDRNYLLFWLRGEYFQREVANFGGRAAQAGFNKEDLKGLQIPLPPLPEQKRIAAILDKADEIRRKRQQALDLTDTFLRSTFLEMFGDPVTNPMGWEVSSLNDLGQVQGGLQVTHRRKINPIELPYLRVANVFRDTLNLDEVKMIKVTEAERDRVILKIGDILIVEGHGNPHELGRSAIWDSSISECLHQNHLIRFRPNQDLLLPQYASFFINSDGGRRQMLKSGKTTSGLNTISSRNVKETKIPLPTVNKQKKFQEIAEQHKLDRKTLFKQLIKSENLFSSLQQKAFRGEL